MGKLNLKKFKCGGCYEIFTTNEFTRKCEWCGSSLLEPQDVLAKDYIDFVSGSLEDGNFHDLVELPGKIYRRLNYKSCDNPDLARIIAEEFYNNI